MAVRENRSESEAGALGFWLICAGHYRVRDRGDGIAEITVCKSLVVTSDRMAGVLGKECGDVVKVDYVVGHIYESVVPQSMTADGEEPRRSAFPGTLRWCNDDAMQYLVSSVDDLEQMIPAYYATNATNN